MSLVSVLHILTSTPVYAVSQCVTRSSVDSVLVEMEVNARPSIYPGVLTDISDEVCDSVECKRGSNLGTN